MKLTRRSVLDAFPRGAAVAGLTGLSEFSAPFFGPPELPDTPEPTHRNWLPAPTTTPAPDGISRDDWENKFSEPIVAIDAESLRRHRERVPADFYAEWASTGRVLDPAGLPFDHVQEVIYRMNSGPIVMTGDVSVADAVDTVRAGGYERYGEHRGFELYRRPGIGRYIAVADAGILWTWDYSGADEPNVNEPKLRAHIDAYRGAVPRRHEKSKSYRQFADSLGKTTVQYCRLTPHDGAETETGIGYGIALDGNVVYAQTQYYFGSEDAVDRDEIRDRDHLTTDWADDWSIVTRGQRIEATTKCLISNLYARHDDPDEVGRAAPMAAFGYEYDEDAGRLRSTHRAGEPVPVDRFEVYDGDTPRPASELVDGAMFERGDEIVVDVPADVGEITFLYVTPSGSLSIEMGRYDLEEKAPA